MKKIPDEISIIDGKVFASQNASLRTMMTVNKILRYGQPKERLPRKQKKRAKSIFGLRTSSISLLKHILSGKKFVSDQSDLPF